MADAQPAKTPLVQLVPVTRQNYVQVFDLEVAPEQKQFVADTAFSLVQAAYEPNWEPRAIVAGGSVVGFLMGGIIEPGVYEISRLLVDRAYQGKGYGRAGLALFLEQLDKRPDVEIVKTSYIPGNTYAPDFYATFDFRTTDERWQDELVMARLPKRRGA
ncbi:GNAT family N-acetyltransferase [Niveibacterium sp. SC-1]|uniref:GNAT family N-acetyltransferase n=1 Tax=Niveibacterium sp. SC-1 TaxID=3135646 RepID=UPI00311E367E